MTVDPRPMLVKVAAADPVVQAELLSWFEAAQALSVENAGLRNSLQFARGDIERLTRERDLAIAHDTQPYPTAWAYEQACKTRDRLRAALDEIAWVGFDTNDECPWCRADVEDGHETDCAAMRAARALAAEEEKP